MDGRGGGFRTRSDRKTPGPSGCEGPGAVISNLQENTYQILLNLSKNLKRFFTAGSAGTPPPFNAGPAPPPS